MPKRDDAVNAHVLSTTPRRSPRFPRKETLEQGHVMDAGEHSRPSRRRVVVARERGDPKSPKDLPVKSKKRCSESVPQKPRKSSDGLKTRVNLSAGSRKSRVLGDGIEGFSNPRRSLRISGRCKEAFFGESKGLGERAAKEFGDSGSVKYPRTSNGVEGFQQLRHSARLSNQLREKTRGDASAIEKGQSGIVKAENFEAKKAKREKLRSVTVDSKAAIERKCEQQEAEEEKELEIEKSRAVEVCRMRKIDELEESNETVQGWTKEQELALRRAYFTANPTPQFWKKVSRLVPGKSAQDCFDKVNSDYATPPQRCCVSRAKRKHSSPIPHSQLSASKVLNPIEPKRRKPSRYKQKSHVIHRNARHLLQEQYHQSHVREADLFSVLEPDFDLHRQALHPGTTEVSTPKQLRERKQGFQSSSGHKKPLSTFNALASPPVLKMVKDRALHEKHLDQLHIREAQRKAASRQARKSSLKIDVKHESHDVVLKAKTALVSDAITMLQQVHSNATSNATDLEYDMFNDDDEENEM